MSTEIRFFELLESRTLFATFTAADYVALYAGRTATHNSTINLAVPTINGVELQGNVASANPVGAAALSWMNIVAIVYLYNDDPTIKGLSPAAVTNIDAMRVDTRHAITGTSAVIGSSRVFRDNGRAGIAEYDFQIGGATTNIAANITYPSTIPLLPQRFGTGQISNWSARPVTAKLNVPGTVLNGQKLSGTDTGFVIVTDNGPDTELGYDLTSTLTLAVQHSQTFTPIAIAGKTYRVSTNIQEQLNLAKGVGLINGSTTLQVQIVSTDFAYSAFIVHSQQFDQITASSELSTFTRVTGGNTIRVGGTGHDDVIGAGFSDGGSNILVLRNGVGKTFSSSGINRIVIDAAGGNDTVGPLKLGRMKSALIGGLGNDYLIGGPGRDLIYGGDGNDILVGGPGIDTLFGDAGNDILNGLNGADSIDGGLGTDTAKQDDTDTRIAIEVLV